MALRDLRRSTELELLCDDGGPLENEIHGSLSWDSLVLSLRDYFKRTGFRAYVSINSAVFYPGARDPLGPDVFVVNGGAYHRQAYWYVEAEGGLYPTLIIEMLSPSTEKHDRCPSCESATLVSATERYVCFTCGQERDELWQCPRCGGPMEDADDVICSGCMSDLLQKE